jgi:hypothetical protein
MPEDVLAHVPPYDSERYGTREDPGPHYGEKLDMNDFINKRAQELFPELRKKYAYKP